MVDEFEFLVIPFETTPNEIKELNNGGDGEGEVVIYPKDKVRWRAEQMISLISGSEYQTYEYGNYIVQISSPNDRNDEEFNLLTF